MTTPYTIQTVECDGVFRVDDEPRHWTEHPDHCKCNGTGKIHEEVEVTPCLGCVGCKPPPPQKPQCTNGWIGGEPVFEIFNLVGVGADLPSRWRRIGGDWEGGGFHTDRESIAAAVEACGKAWRQSI